MNRLPVRPFISGITNRINRLAMVLAVAVVAALCIMGCSSHIIDEPHVPAQSRISGAETLAVAVDISSSRGNAAETQIGEFGRRDIVLASAYEDWIADGLISEYRRAGFDAGRGSVTGSGAAQVRVEVEQLFGEGVSNCKLILECVGASAVFDVELTDPRTGNRYGRRFVGTSSSESMSLDVEDLEDEIRRALTKTFAEIVDETHALLTAASSN